MNVDHMYNVQQTNWTADLCGCGSDAATCFITCFLPCVTYGQISEVVDEGRSSCFGQGCVYGGLMICGFHWLISCVYREKLRSKFGIPGDACSDCCVHFCCEPCALCQEHAELKSRGFDPSRGYVQPQGWTGPPSAPPAIPPSMYK